MAQVRFRHLWDQPLMPWRPSWREAGESAVRRRATLKVAQIDEKATDRRAPDRGHNEIDAMAGVSRRDGPAGEEVAVLIRRTYDAPNTDVWDALTDPERMKRWFYPMRRLQAGGTFQLEGNAGGDVACEPPRLLRVTFGGRPAWSSSGSPPTVRTAPCSSWSTPSLSPSP